VVAVAVVMTVAAVTAVAAVVTLAVVVDVADVSTATVVVIGLSSLSSPEHATVVVPSETRPGPVSGQVESVSEGVTLVSGEDAPQTPGRMGLVLSGGAVQVSGAMEHVSGRVEPPELPSQASASMFAVHISGDGEKQTLVFMAPRLGSNHRSTINILFHCTVYLKYCTIVKLLLWYVTVITFYHCSVAT